MDLNGSPREKTSTGQSVMKKQLSDVVPRGAWDSRPPLGSAGTVTASLPVAVQDAAQVTFYSELGHSCEGDNPHHAR